MHLKSPYPPVPELSLQTKNYFALTLELSQQFPAPEPEPEHVLYIDAMSGEERTKSQFFERVHDAATVFAAPKQSGGLGLNKNHTVAVLSHNCLDFPVIAFALLSAAVPFSLYSSFATTHELEHYHQKAQSTHVFVHADLLGQFLPVARKTNFPEENIFILEGKHDSKFKDFDSLIKNVRIRKIHREPIRNVQRDDLAYLIFSSGTGGLPKCVMVSHGNLCFAVLQDIVISSTYQKLKPDTGPATKSVVLSSVPMFHTLGLHYLALKPPIGYNTIVILPKWNKDLFIEAIPRYRITCLIIIPSAVHQLLSSPRFNEIDRSSIEIVGSAASHLPPALAKKLQNNLANVPIREGFGMSEATLCTVGRHQSVLTEMGLYDPNSTGVIEPGMEGLILRPDGTHCLVNEPGELFLKGPNITHGYRDDPEATKMVFLGGGWIRTGDRFRADARGLLYFEDRAKDTLKVSGLQVSPAEIEETIHAEPSSIVQDVSVAGVQLPNARTTDDKVPRAWVVLTEAGRRLPENEARTRIDAWVKERLSKYKWLRGGIKFIDAIPRNSTGKALRRLLVEEYETEKKQAQAKL